MKFTLSIIRLCFIMVFWLITPSVKAQNEIDKMQGRLDIWATPVLPFDFHSPKIKIIYSYVNGDRPITIALPTEDQLRFFTQIEVIADGKNVDFEPGIKLLAIEYGNRISLSPGQSVDLIISLDKIALKLPKEWESLEIRPIALGTFSFDANNRRKWIVGLYRDAATGILKILRPRWKKPDYLTPVYETTTPAQRRQAVQNAMLGYIYQHIPDDVDKGLANMGEGENENKAMLQNLKAKTKFAPPPQGQTFNTTARLSLQSEGTGYELRYDVEKGAIEIAPNEWGIVSDEFRNWIKGLLNRNAGSRQ